MLERIWKIISFTPPEGQTFELLSGRLAAEGDEEKAGRGKQESAPGAAAAGAEQPGREPKETPAAGAREEETAPAGTAAEQPAAKGKKRPPRARTRPKLVLGKQPATVAPPVAGPHPERAGGEQQQKMQADGKQLKQPVPAAAYACARQDGGKDRISADLKQNIACLKKIFHVPLNKDVIFREFAIGTEPPVAAAAVYIDGMTDRQVQDNSLLRPLMLMPPGQPAGGVTVLDMVVRHLLPGNQVDTSEEMRDVVDAVLSGSTVLLVDYCPKAIVVETKGWEHRQVERPFTEQVVRGPQEAFTETMRTNTALVRKALHSPDLVTEFYKVGRLARTDVALMYIEGLTNPRLVDEVRRRLKNIRADFVSHSGLLEQFIEDNTYALVPQTLATERPDRVVAGLTEGHVALLVDNSPYALLVPVTFFTIFHTAEDAYIRWPYGSMLRIIRLIGLFLATFLPGFYIAVIAFHHEMIPTDLLMAISASREMVPFPSVVEVFLMEGSFELIREAGIRVPGIIGPTLGIVGALILGQAAVAAHIVSPILIIVVAVTAIGSFTIPNYSLSLSVRLLRFVYILCGAVMGILGLVLGFFIHLHLLAGTKSFGVPFLAPVAPITGRASDVLFRGPIWKQEKRPGFLLVQKQERQPRISRRWTKRPRSGERGGKSAQ